MFSEVMLALTVLVKEITELIDIVVVGAEIEVLIRGPDGGNPVVLRLVKTDP